jgi:hypothetical protein
MAAPAIAAIIGAEPLAPVIRTASDQDALPMKAPRGKPYE